MINTLAKNNYKTKLSMENFPQEVFLLPKWEKIKSFSVIKNRFLFTKSVLKYDLYRRFSAKNSLEKYSVRLKDNKIIANMDLKIYKDCVYIINFSNKNFEEEALEKLLQTAVEKALYNTEAKEVYFNLSLDYAKRNKLKKILINNEFEIVSNQSNYEKQMFGELFKLDASINKYWADKIKQMPILINK